MVYKCILCENDTSSRYKYLDDININYYNPYMERGITKKHFLCGDCMMNKIRVRDYGANETKRNDAIESLENNIKDKSDLIQSIVKSWIDGEEKNYYTNINDLVYYVPGPHAELFVFKDYLTILSSFDNDKDWGMFYGIIEAYDKKTQKKERQIGFEACYFSSYTDLRDISDIEKINCKSILLKLASHRDLTKKGTQSIELNLSLGEYGCLEFKDVRGSIWDIDADFKFYYHQNQLMEEVYNYIKNRMENPDAEDEEIEQNTVNARKVSSEPAGKKTEETTVVYSPADEIKKMKELFDCGILSQDEFDEAKKRLISKL